MKSDVLANYPNSKSGRWKRKKADNLQAITGQAYCTSCRTVQPVSDIHLIPGVIQGVRPICTRCLNNKRPPTKVRVA